MTSASSFSTFGYGIDNSVWNLNAGSQTVVRRPIYGFAVDLDNNRIWARSSADPNQFWNNSNTANPATNSGGFDIATVNDGVSVMPSFSGFFGSSIADIGTLNTGFTTFSMTSLPSGFSAWDATSATTWNPSDKSASITLTNGNRTATQSTTGSTWASVRATSSSKHTGKWYFEISIDKRDPNLGWIAGVANATESLATFSGNSNNSVGYQVNQAYYKNNSATSSAGPTTNFSTWRSTVATSLGRHTGKWYFEAKVDVKTSADGWIFGVANTTFAATLSDIDNYSGSDGAGTSVGIQSGSTFAGAAAYYIAATSNGSGIVGAVQGDVYCAAVDLTNNKIWFRLNGGGWTLNGTGDPVNNTGGISITTVNDGVGVMPVWSGFNDTGIAEQMTLRTQVAQFSFTPPTGFSAWDISTSGQLGAGTLSSSPVSSDPGAQGTAGGTPAFTPTSSSTLQVTQLAAEVIETQTSQAQFHQLVAEVLSVKTPALRVGMVALEVLRSNQGFIHPTARPQRHRRR